MSTVKSKNLQVGTDATASNNFTIYQPSTPDGTLRIGVGNADSPTEVGRFNSNGYVATNAPAFLAYQNSAQTIGSSVTTKFSIDTEVFDTANCFDHTTNYRFTPNVAGYYLVGGSFRWSSNTTGDRQCMFYKNGAEIQTFVRSPTASTGSCAYNYSTLVEMNGSTDYLELYIYQNSGGNLTTLISGRSNSFWASLVRAT